MRHVVIVGAGFAGLNCARRLATHSDFRITLIDKNNYQQFQPLLYQVATGLLSPSNTAFSLRAILQDHSNVDIKMAEVVSADLNSRTVTTTEGQTYRGDYLVLAAGSQVNFFRTEGADTHAYPLYSLADAERLRSHILEIFESADRDPSLVEKGALTFVIVGAGPTGVETAGALGDMMLRRLKHVYGDLDVSRGRIVLADLAPVVLSAFSDESQTYVSSALNEHGVQVRLGSAAREITSGHVVFADGDTIPTRTVIWAGGLKAASLSSNLGIGSGHGGRIVVEPDLSIKGFPDVYALGDFADTAGRDGKPLPQLASVAEQAGKHCAKNIANAAAGKPQEPFHYLDKGIMAMVGRNTAVAEVGEDRHELTGPIAFVAWLGIHAALLMTARARIEAFIEWAWDYFGAVHVDPVLDRPENPGIKWNDTE
jgi:NADH dehydrogenase